MNPVFIWFERCLPSGVTQLYLKTSKMIALMYGSLSQSPSVGNLSPSVTWSISSCARCMTDGCSDIRAKKVRRVELVLVAEWDQFHAWKKQQRLTESVAAPYMTDAQSMISSSFCLASSREREVSAAISSRDVETKHGAAVPSSLQNWKEQDEVNSQLELEHNEDAYYILFRPHKGINSACTEDFLNFIQGFVQPWKWQEGRPVPHCQYRCYSWNDWNTTRTILTIRTNFNQESHRSSKFFGLLKRSLHFVDYGIISTRYTIAVCPQ